MKELQVEIYANSAEGSFTLTSHQLGESFSVSGVIAEQVSLKFNEYEGSIEGTWPEVVLNLVEPEIFDIQGMKLICSQATK